ncbi:protein-glutamine gamma-glutamyltransferase [Rossellomorea aquimaris]|uniref:protein-glutamine gamma-glutamyltransferase n=1 Tax=Rossellomorea aquimaris TaxID=189382 RepID=UPI000AF58277|nr:protein-glutamine gamma-glutamyltransferase [Rossellomorea aquimaris]
MISISDGSFSKNATKLTSNEKKILNALENSPTEYQYRNLDELYYEIRLREKIITNSRLLNDSDAKFSSFEHSYFNPTFWTKQNNGYLLNKGKRPSEAIEDIFTNSSAYSFECVTSIVLIYYKSILDTINTHYFNELFSQLLVWGHHFDSDLSMVTYEGLDYIPGDVYYFYNPDFEDPIWMGENSVYLEEGQYFGHGIGIVTHNEMVEALNSLRKEDAKKDAYLLEQVTRLVFSDFYLYT